MLVEIAGRGRGAEALHADDGIGRSRPVELLCALEAGGLLTLTAGDECILVREPGTISVLAILTIARNQKSGDFIARDARVAAVDALIARLDSAWRAACADETLEDLLQECAAAPLLVAGDSHVLNEHGPRM